MGHAQIHKERMEGDDLEIDTAQTPKRLNGRPALLEKIQETLTDSTILKHALNVHSETDYRYVTCFMLK